MNIVYIGWILVLLSAGCATHRGVERAGGVTVHTFRRHYNNAHVIDDGRHRFMVDAGLERDAPALARDLRDGGLPPESLRAVVLTHGHADHAGGALYFRRQFGIPIVAGAGDEALLAAGENDHLCPTSGQAEDWVEEDQAATFTPYAADHWVRDRLDLRALTGVAATVISLPGHTEGSVVVRLPRAVVVGDLFRGAIVGNSAEMHFYMCDLDDNRRDVRALLEQAPSAELFFVGHFGPVTRDAVVARFVEP